MCLFPATFITLQSPPNRGSKQARDGRVSNKTSLSPEAPDGRRCLNCCTPHHPPHHHLLPTPFLLLHPSWRPWPPPVPLGQSRFPLSPSLWPVHTPLCLPSLTLLICPGSLQGEHGLGALSYLRLTNSLSLQNHIISSLRVGDLVSKVPHTVNSMPYTPFSGC